MNTGVSTNRRVTVRHLVRCAVALIALCPVLAPAGEPAKTAKPAAKKPKETWPPTSHYEERKIEGWRVLVNKDFVRDEPKLLEQTLRLLEFQLYQIPRRVPAAAVAKLRQVTVWVEEKEPNHPCMAFHPNPGWLREHNMNPDKAPCVEIANARNFLRWTREQPWMVLHELAHAYHFRFLDRGFGNPEVRAAYERAKKAKRYDKILHWQGRTVKAYAIKNPMEYFAETSEAFFGANDMYPFVNAELKRHDPEMHKLLARLWGVSRKKLSRPKGKKRTPK